jgi:hypothetical protein
MLTMFLTGIALIAGVVVLTWAVQLSQRLQPWLRPPTPMGDDSLDLSYPVNEYQLRRELGLPPSPEAAATRARAQLIDQRDRAKAARAARIPSA